MLSRFAGLWRLPTEVTLRLRQKIIAGFVVVLAISSASFIVAYIGFERVSAAVTAFRQSVAEADLARNIDHHLDRYRLLANYYVVTGKEEDSKAALEAEKSLKAVLESGLAKTQAPALLGKQVTEFDNFVSTFGEVLKAKRQSAAMAQNQLARGANSLKYKLEAIAGDAADSKSAAAEAGARQAGAQLQTAVAFVSIFVVNADPAAVASALARLKFVENTLNDISATEERVMAGVRDAKELLRDYEKALATIIDNTKAVGVLVDKMTRSADVIVIGIANITAGVASEQQRLEAEADAITTQTQWLILSLAIGALLFSLLLAVLLGRGISRPITAICKAMRELGSGNFEVVLPGLGRRDEIGEMAGAVEEFKVQAIARVARESALQDNRSRAAAEARRAELMGFADAFEGEVGAIVSNVSASALRLEQAADSLKRTADGNQILAGQASGASEAVASSIQSIASATEQLSASVDEIGRRVRDSNRIAEAAVVQAQRTDMRIGRLSRAATEIGDVVRLITAIAAQTDLLALNATIEAARAGDAGRGFAVVASEVKSLANQTAKATEEISNHISTMQGATEESVRAIKEVGATITEISSIASAIVQAVEQQGAATQEIAANAQSVAKGTQQATANFAKVNRGATDTGIASHEVLRSAQTLSGDGVRLRTELDRFMSNIRTA